MLFRSPSTIRSCALSLILTSERYSNPRCCLVLSEIRHLSKMRNLATDLHVALELSRQSVRRLAHRRPELLSNHRCDDPSTIINQAYRPFPLRLHIPRGIFSGVVFAACLPVASALSNGDDLSNNLFSDLAPILALFGEQVAKQFMAGSLGWTDNILFAMVVLPVHSFPGAFH